MAVELYAEIEGLLGNTLFLATGLSWSSIFRGFVFLVALWVSRQSIIFVQCWYTSGARGGGGAVFLCRAHSVLVVLGVGN